MGNWSSNRNKTACGNTDNRANAHAFYEPTLSQEISIYEIGGAEALNDSMEHLHNVGVINTKMNGGSITELESLILGWRLAKQVGR